MNEKRIYEKKVSIDTEHVRNFYNKRAAAASAGDVGAVLLGSQDPQSLDQRNSYDREYVLPMLNIGADTRVLDIGCGIGRWAGFILPNCGFYCGVDFSSEMIKAANQVCQGLGGSYALHCMSAVDAAAQGAEFYGGKFGAVIIAGVCMYINDHDAAQLFGSLPELLEEHATVYLAEPVGLQKRLTLNDFPSEALQTDYSAIYRTVGEYMELCAPLFEAGCSVFKQEFRPKYSESYSDTDRCHIILRR